MRRLVVISFLLLAGCGNGGASSSSSGGSGGGGGTPCDTKSLSVTGSLDGATVSIELGVQHAVTEGAPAADVFACSGGDLLMAPDTALVRMPEGAPHAGEWYCAGKGSTVSAGAGVQASLTSFAKLGACPGAGAAGTVTGCVDPTGMGACLGSVNDILMGTIAGTMVGRSGEALAAFLPPGLDPGTLDLVYAGGSRLVLEIEGNPDGDDTELKLTGGALAMGAEGPDPGAVYCVGSGTIDLASPTTFSVGTLTRLGACGDTPVDGALTVAQATSK